jgi:hypothetical protein
MVKKRRKFTALTIQRYLTVKMTRSCVASEYSARRNYVLRKADESISKRKTRKEDYRKARLGLGGSSRSNELTRRVVL